MKLEKNKQKKCPRCGFKMHIDMVKCPYCGLLFERIQNLSNKQAKKELKEKNTKNVLNVTTMPADVNRKKFYLLFAFLGFFGAYNLYVGKKKTGTYQLVSAVLGIVSFIIYEIINSFNANSAQIFYYFVTGSLLLFFSIGILIWFFDLFKLFGKKFKYPASLTEQDKEKVIAKKIKGV